MKERAKNIGFTWHSRLHSLLSSQCWTAIKFLYPTGRFSSCKCCMHIYMYTWMSQFYDLIHVFWYKQKYTSTVGYFTCFGQIETNIRVYIFLRNMANLWKSVKKSYKIGNLPKLLQNISPKPKLHLNFKGKLENIHPWTNMWTICWWLRLPDCRCRFYLMSSHVLVLICIVESPKSGI